MSDSPDNILSWDQALRGFFKIAQAWRLSHEEVRALLGSPPERTYSAWQRGKAERISSDILRRIGYVAWIYQALQILYVDQRNADTWVRRPNSAFGGQTPLKRMCTGGVPDLAAVRAYLAALPGSNPSVAVSHGDAALLSPQPPAPPIRRRSF